MLKSTLKFQKILLLAAVTLFAAGNSTFSQDVEIGILSGTSNYLGDIGGNSNSAPISLDLQSQTIKTAIGTYIRFNLSSKVALRVNAIYGQIAASDNKTSDYARNLRNLHFRSNIFEVSTQTEITILKKDIFSKKNPHNKTATKYRQDIESTIKNHANGNEFALYSFIGIGMVHFNPQAEYNGTWYDLQPLGTEGQGTVTAEYTGTENEKYSLNEMIIPMGIGMYYLMSNGIKVGFEVGWRKTFTDYLDDVSTEYVDPAQVEAMHGPIAAALSNRTHEVTSNPAELANFMKGDKRGNPNINDSYFFTLLTLSYTIKSK